MAQEISTNVQGPESTVQPPRLSEFLKYFLRLGTLGFGGPIALAGYMQRDLVEQRRWISKEDYVEGLAFSQLSPGPLAAQLAMYLGWVRAGATGATLTGLAFIGPSFAMVLILAALYIRFGELRWMQGLFYGISAAVIAIIARSAYKLTKLTLGKDSLLWVIFAVSAVFTGWTRTENIWLFLASGLIALVIRGRIKIATHAACLAFIPVPDWLVTGSRGPAELNTLGHVLWFFTKAGAFVFGSGLAIVPFLHAGVVDQFHWLNERQFMDSVAVAMITPGPVVITSGFIGYLAAGLAGACLAAIGVFLPPYLFVVFLAPYYRRFGTNPKVKAFIGGVTAAATGAIAGAAYVLGVAAIKDVLTAGICVAVLIVLLWTKKVPEPILILIAGMIGLAAS